MRRWRPSGRRRGAPTAAAATTGPATHGTTVASRAFTLVRGNDRTRVGPAAPGPLPVAMRGTVESLDEAVGLVLVFPLLRARPGCMRQVELWLRVLRLDPVPDLAAYPSSLVALASSRPATWVGSDTLLDNRPRGTAL